MGGHTMLMYYLTQYFKDWSVEPIQSQSKFHHVFVEIGKWILKCIWNKKDLK